MSRKAIDIESLAVGERLALIEELWMSLSDYPAQIPVSQADRDELDRRLADMQDGDEGGIPWQEALNRIRSRLE